MKPTEISGSTRLAGFIADPAKHSLSPCMHNLAFELTHIDAVYLAFTVPKNDLSDVVQAIRTFDMLGVNISMPHKVAVIDQLDELSDEAKLIGAVNTIENQKGYLIGHNTDGIGFMASLRANGINYQGKTMTVLGAGGAATAIVCQAALAGVQTIHVFNRPSPRFEKMQAKISQITEISTCQIDLRDFAEAERLNQAIAASKVLVNCTNVGMDGSHSPITDFQAINSETVVYDIIYQPRQTPFLKAAQARGAKTFNGLGMLLYQGATAFKIWTGKDMPVDQIYPVLANK